MTINFCCTERKILFMLKTKLSSNLIFVKKWDSNFNNKKLNLLDNIDDIDEWIDIDDSDEYWWRIVAIGFTVSKLMGHHNILRQKNIFGKVNMSNRHSNYRQHTFQKLFQETWDQMIFICLVM